ncbi:hypothetical protein HMPREF1567_1216 [Providencia alcalifaciens PAL-2]|nr:hypothetical protein HMPREF1567_1216 [Providencia alcalifaciens PAL-2]
MLRQYNNCAANFNMKITYLFLLVNRIIKIAGIICYGM